MAVLEAITVGKPVVTTRVGAMQDVLVSGKHGELINAGDTAGLAKGILRLLDDPDYRARVAKENGEYSRRMFSQAVIANHLAIYINASIDEKAPPINVQLGK